MGSVSGRILIAGTASLLLCLFLSPRFIAFLRGKEFGQSIREEGPEGHQTKAGTPTLGGVIIVIAFAVPFLVLSNRDWQSLGVFGATFACALLGFADDYTKIVKRRSLGLRARTKLVVTVAISVALWWIGAIRNTRLRKAWKERTWTTTDSASITKIPPSRIKSISVLVMTASPAIAPPSASEPVSPMKMLAGKLLNHRKPMHAPTRQPASSVRSR